MNSQEPLRRALATLAPCLLRATPLELATGHFDESTKCLPIECIEHASFEGPMEDVKNVVRRKAEKEQRPTDWIEHACV